MKVLSVLLLLIFLTTISKSQIIIPTTLGKKFTIGYYAKPLKLVVVGFSKATAEERQDMITSVRNFGFTDSILLFTPPEYPNKAYRDSVDDICAKAHIASFMEISFTTISSSWYNLSRSESTAIKVIYKVYDWATAKVENPGLLFGAGSMASIKKLFNKAVPIQ